MPVLPAWLVTILIKVVLPIILGDLVKAGLLSEAGKVAAQYGIDFDQFLKKLKTYPKYPTGKNGEQEPVSPAVTNIAPITDEVLDRQLGQRIRGQYPVDRNGK